MLNGKLCKWGENMFIYAHLNEKNICIGFATFAKPIDSARYVQINSENQDLLYHKYENGQWSEEKYPPPEPEPFPSLEEMQIQTLLNMEYLVILSEIEHLGARYL